MKKTDAPLAFPETAGFISRLEDFTGRERTEEIFIDPNGEGLVNSELAAVIKLLKRKNIRVKLLSNGYVFNYPRYSGILKSCDSLIGELSTCREEDFQRLQRPMNGFTLERYVRGMADFNAGYKGRLTLNITLLKGYSDNESALGFFKKAIQAIKPDSVYCETPGFGNLKNVFGIDDAALSRFREELSAEADRGK